MFRLYLAGKGATEIARMCEAGTAGCAPFLAKRRTVQDIVTEMAQEAGGEPPKTLSDLEQGAVDGFPKRSLAILEREMTRLEEKQGRGNGLSLRDAECLGRMVQMFPAIERRLRRPASRTASRRRAPRKQDVEGSALERLARQMGQTGDGEQPSSTRTPPKADEIGIDPVVATRSQPSVETPDPGAHKPRSAIPPVEARQAALDAARAVAAERGELTPELAAMQVPGDSAPLAPLSESQRRNLAARENARAARVETQAAGEG